ncbi:uroporphyrinogen decarboxylase [Microbacterium mitrae]|uniref:Uroporphyrinogen decarboxylase n=1 Tax=Microbacterium mitrae TaxID=664640 RepID=A0A5C8HQF7_9MICO|nr:uroporphyrinogen decarboxylase [Microbacterium mitrae]TXK06346.1 uroporphyrinogen decarboxylase [Microbacterium mitrae]
MPLAPEHPLSDGRTASAPLVLAARGEKQQTPPIWFMRQAGRSLPEYHQVRGTTGMLQACLTPELAAEITLQPVLRHGVDAAVFYSDIVIPPLIAGVDVEIVAGRGPVFAKPVRTAADVAALPALDSLDFTPIREAIAIITAELGSTPLIGFGGAPFTLASYLIEGGPSKDQARARAMMLAEPATFSALLAWCADATAQFMRAQVEAGASVVQLFDSWAGSLSRATWQTHVAPHSASIFAALSDLDVPRIHFGLGMRDMLDLIPDLGATTVGIDWRMPLDDAAAVLGDRAGVQGNIDPAVLGAGWDAIRTNVDDVVARGRAARSHIVNLGHGVTPDTKPALLTRIVEHVHAL